MDNTCIFCGKIIPEGMTVCPICMDRLGSIAPDRTVKGKRHKTFKMVTKTPKMTDEEYAKILDSVRTCECK